MNSFRSFPCALAKVACWRAFVLLASVSASVLFISFGGAATAAEAGARPAEVFVECESFDDLGGWKLDTQFIQQMGSPYLLAHGLGKPVDDATKEVKIKQSGTYRVWVRTFDWVARWDAAGSPGKFELSIGGNKLARTFGTEGKQWSWHDGGSVELPEGNVELRLHDLTGFDGRCDCVYLTSDLEATPPPTGGVLSQWRRDQLGLPETPAERGPYDLVVVGGGYAGMASAISAARMGCRVALVQDRGVLGGNGSSEVRVWAMGNIRRGKFPRIGEIVEEFSDKATKSPGRYEEFGDQQKEAIVRAEPQIDLWLNHHVFDAAVDDRKIQSVDALNTKTGEVVRMIGARFADCTGHGWLGQFVGADSDMAPDGRMGMSNMWRWDETESKTEFPETPWALDLKMEDFPYPRDHHGQWFWESGFNKDAIGDAEGIRDWNLRAVYGAFNAMKNRDGATDHANAVLTWVAYVGGPRESNRLLGDVILEQDDIVAKREFPDGCVPSTWSIDLHYPKEEFADKYPDNPFISKAVHDRRVDRMYGYPVPYRCFYSRNIDNLFMAGRNVSVTHQALGTVRVMKTCGMMGEVVGKAASICAANDCSPRDVYEQHLTELLGMLELPGKARRSTPSAPITIDPGALPRASKFGPPTGLDPETLDGIILDDRDAKMEGKWNAGSTGRRYVGYGYQYAGNGSQAKATYTFTAKEDGTYQFGLRSAPFDNRSTSAPVELRHDGAVVESFVNYQGSEDGEFVSVGSLQLKKGDTVEVVQLTDGVKGLVHLDALQVLKKD